MFAFSYYRANKALSDKDDKLLFDGNGDSIPLKGGKFVNFTSLLFVAFKNG